MTAPFRGEIFELDSLFDENSDAAKAVTRSFFEGEGHVGTRVVPVGGLRFTNRGRGRVYLPNLQSVGMGTPVRPVVSIVSPTPNGPIGEHEPFLFEVTCDEEIVSQRFNLRTTGDQGPWEVQYRDGATGPGPTVLRTAITNGFRFTVTPVGRWAGQQIHFEPTFGTALAVAATNE